MEVKKVCPVCGTVTTLEVDAKEYQDWLGGKLIQQAMPTTHKADREVLISGMCYNCYEEMFNEPAPGNESKFGNRLGCCSCCDRAVYSKDVKDGFVCKACGSEEFE